MALSSMASASSFFSLAFSSSNAFSLRASLTSIPPNLDFHLKNVALLIPCLRQTSAVDTPPSCSRNTPMICSSVNLDFLIVQLLPQAVGLYSFLDQFVGLRSEGLSFKKSLHATEQERPDIARRRYWWQKYQPRLDIERRVFIDETWAKTNMAPIRGWCRKGERLVARVPHGHWKTMTFLAGLRCTGITAPCVFDGPINGESFRLYVEQILVPSLKRGDIVIMDNLGSHKGEAIRAIIKGAGARLLFLPPYSPDLNPIEQVFAKLKHLLRKASERTAEATWQRIGELLRAFNADECRNYFINAGWTGLTS